MVKIVVSFVVFLQVYVKIMIYVTVMQYKFERVRFVVFFYFNQETISNN